jgi:hypothetical protein
MKGSELGSQTPTRSVDLILARCFSAGIMHPTTFLSRQRRLNPASVATLRTNFHIDLSRSGKAGLKSIVALRRNTLASLEIENMTITLEIFSDYV